MSAGNVASSLGLWLLASLALALSGIAWLLFKGIAYLRKRGSRYRWFELFTCLFLVAWGFFILLKFPHDRWTTWWALFAGGSIFAGATNLGVVFLDRFAGGKVLRCSFCNKSHRDVKKLVAGPRVFICDECIDICVTIIREDKVLEPTPDPVPESTA